MNNNLENNLYSRVNQHLCLFTLHNNSNILVSCSFGAQLPKDIPDSFLNKHPVNACSQGGAFDEFPSVSLPRSEARTSVMCCERTIPDIESSDQS